MGLPGANVGHVDVEGLQGLNVGPCRGASMLRVCRAERRGCRVDAHPTPRAHPGLPDGDRAVAVAVPRLLRGRHLVVPSFLEPWLEREPVPAAVGATGGRGIHDRCALSEVDEGDGRWTRDVEPLQPPPVGVVGQHQGFGIVLRGIADKLPRFPSCRRRQEMVLADERAGCRCVAKACRASEVGQALEADIVDVKVLPDAIAAKAQPDSRDVVGVAER